MNVTTTNGNTALMSFIERAANNPEFDVAKFGELLRLQRDVAHDQSRRAFNAAMADAQSEMLPVVRDAKNSHLNNRYARLETIDAAMRPIYTRHGFSVRYGSAPASSEGMIRITCTVAHADGYFEEQYLDAPTVNAGSQGGRTATTPVQAVGSAITYLRRYLLSMVFNVVLADEDDDGEFTRRPAAAAATPRPPKMVGKTDEQWRNWLGKLRTACATLYKRSEVVEVGGRGTVAEAAASGPDWVKQEIAAILAENYARLPDEEQPEEERADEPVG
jgi:hypothetical protein